MPQFLKILALGSVLATALAAAPTLYAEPPQGPGGSRMGIDMPQMMKMMEMCHNMMRAEMMGEPGPQQPHEK